MKKILKWIGIVFLFFIIIGLFSGGKSKKDNLSPTITSIPKQNEATVTPTQEPKKDLFKVVKVIDGDTIQVDIKGKIETVRLIGVDAPESVDPRKPVQCFGKEASNKAKEVLERKYVKLLVDRSQGDKDKYGRLVRYVFLEDGANFNKIMIAEGYAHESTYQTPYEYQTEFREAEKEARENRKGLWADNVCDLNIEPTVKTTQSKIDQPTSTTGSFSCSGKTRCNQMIDCDEARFYLTNCGVASLDRDKDGVPCEDICN